jgi:hypothetical protein
MEACQIKYHAGEDVVKVKFILDGNAAHVNEHKEVETVLQWSAPSDGQYKLNTNGSFRTVGDASAGIVVRGHNGSIILLANKRVRLL